MVTFAAKWKVVVHICEQHWVSQRRAFDLVTVDRSSVRYRSIRLDDVGLRQAMNDVAAKRRRIGYRRILIVFEHQDIRMKKKLRRLYREEGLQVGKPGGRKRVLGTRRPAVVPKTISERWSLNFVSDASTDGCGLYVLAVVDDFSRGCLALVPNKLLSGERLTRELDAIVEMRELPKTLVND